MPGLVITSSLLVALPETGLSLSSRVLTEAVSSVFGVAPACSAWNVTVTDAACCGSSPLPALMSAQARFPGVLEVVPGTALTNCMYAAL